MTETPNGEDKTTTNAQWRPPTPSAQPPSAQPTVAVPLAQHRPAPPAPSDEAPTGAYPGAPAPGPQSWPAPNAAPADQPTTTYPGQPAYKAAPSPPAPGYGSAQSGPAPTATNWTPETNPTPGPYSGQFGQSTEPAKKNKKLRIAIAAGAAVLVAAAAVAVTGFWKPGYFITRTLDINAVQDGVQKVLTDTENGYSIDDVRGLECNNGANPVITQGATFECKAVINGTDRTMTITFQDDTGTVGVGQPT